MRVLEKNSVTISSLMTSACGYGSRLGARLSDAKHRPGARLAGTTADLIPASRGLDKTSVPGRADQDLVDADARRQARDEGDGAAEILRLQHFRQFLRGRRHRARLQDR